MANDLVINVVVIVAVVWVVDRLLTYATIHLLVTGRSVLQKRSEDDRGSILRMER